MVKVHVRNNEGAVVLDDLRNFVELLRLVLTQVLEQPLRQHDIEGAVAKLDGRF